MRACEVRPGTVALVPLLILSAVALAQTADRPTTPPDGAGPGRSPRFPEMVRIPAAEFLMGSPIADVDSEAYRKCEHPQHPVSVAEFWIGRYLVTAEEFCEFLNDVGNDGYFKEVTGWIDSRTIRKIGEPYSPVFPEARLPTTLRNRTGPYVPQPAAERCPAGPITWAGAQRYCEWLSEKLGHPFRLPTEAEWELAARGAELREWPWGNEVPLLECRPLSAAWARRLRRDAASPTAAFRLSDPIDADVPFYELRGLRWMHTGGFDEQRPWTKVPVGSFPLNATPEGVYDMLGYVFGQWCVDVYDENAYQVGGTPPSTQEPAEGALHVIRGRYAVLMDYDIFLRNTSFLQRLFMGDAVSKEYQLTTGRSWSRFQESPQRFGALFRVTSSQAPPDESP